jgi:CBS domain-containing protein
MTTTQTKVESQIMESSAKALGTFCDDISQMFSVDMSCNQLEPATETVRDLKKRFEKLVAVISVKSEGLLEGTFHFILDTKGLFTLPGVIIMLPEKRILDNAKYGSAEDAENMSDTLGEAGNLMVGSWDRFFREEFEGHGHFAQFDTFVGNPRNIPIDKIGLTNDEEVLFVLHEMTIGSYPPFNCGVIFPRKIFAGISESDIQITTEREDQEKTEETAQDQQAATEKTESEESDESRKSDSVESESQESTAEEASAEGKPEAQQAADDEENAAEAQPEATVSAEGKDQEKTEEIAQEQQAAAEKAESEESDESRKSDIVESESQDSTAEEASAEGKPEAQKAADDEENTAEVQPEATVDAKSDAGQIDVPSDNVEQEEAVFADGTRQEQEGQISESIKRMINPPANFPGEFVQAARTIRAKDIMQKKIVWASGDDSVQQAITKIEQGRSSHLIIGTAGAIEGIVSRSDITGAVSVYLRPMFAKWRRPLDDATLQIKIKWIMSRPARTVNPETPLPTIMERICRCDGYCLPVVDEQGNVQGTITVFDILSVLLRAILTLPPTDRTPEPTTSHSH